MDRKLEKPPQISRKNFLKLSGLTLAALLTGCVPDAPRLPTPTPGISRKELFDQALASDDIVSWQIFLSKMSADLSSPDPTYKPDEQVKTYVAEKFLTPNNFPTVNIPNLEAKDAVLGDYYRNILLPAMVESGFAPFRDVANQLNTLVGAGVLEIKAESFSQNPDKHSGRTGADYHYSWNPERGMHSTINFNSDLHLGFEEYKPNLLADAFIMCHEAAHLFQAKRYIESWREYSEAVNNSPPTDFFLTAVKGSQTELYATWYLAAVVESMMKIDGKKTAEIFPNFIPLAEKYAVLAKRGESFNDQGWALYMKEIVKDSTIIY